MRIQSGTNEQFYERIKGICIHRRMNQDVSNYLKIKSHQFSVSQISDDALQSLLHLEIEIEIYMLGISNILNIINTHNLVVVQ